MEDGDERSELLDEVVNEAVYQGRKRSGRNPSAVDIAGKETHSGAWVAINGGRSGSCLLRLGLIVSTCLPAACCLAMFANPLTRTSSRNLARFSAVRDDPEPDEEDLSLEASRSVCSATKPTASLSISSGSLESPPARRKGEGS